MHKTHWILPRCTRHAIPVEFSPAPNVMHYTWYTYAHRPQVEAEELSYNGRPFREFVVARSAAYISQAGVGPGGVLMGCPDQ